jgi:myo-inositol-1(or 4)-monophosphatase
MESYLTIAVDIAREAGALLAQHFERPKEISYKRPSDLVTDADRRSEALIIERLRSHFPKHSILAEEGGGAETASDYCWYVDPLDGTTNFAHGFPVFCVTLGMAYRGEMVAGVVFDPLREELFTAERGAGAYLNNKRLHVSPAKKLSESLVATGFPPFANNHDRNIKYYYRFTQLCHGVRRAGSAALDLCSVASGRFEGFWELKLNPWDKAAGSLVVLEAGGRVSDLHGGPFDLLADEIFVSNGLVHDEMIKVFSEVMARGAKPLRG